MPIEPKSDETKDQFISRCIGEEINAGYEQEQAAAICYSKWEKQGEMNVSEEAQQGGVVGMSEEFGRKKFEYSPKAKETLNEFMARCMGDDMVREKKKDRGVRAGFCYSQYQQRYIASLAKGWR